MGEDKGVSPRRLDEVIDDAARQLAANEKYRDAEITALHATLMLTIATLNQFDPMASERIAGLLMDRAAAWRERHPNAEPGAAMERLADDLLHRLPPVPSLESA